MNKALCLVRHYPVNQTHPHLRANQQQECTLQHSLVQFKPAHKTLCNPLRVLT